MNSAANTYSGFVAVVGRPNVGKSTLLNAILSRKISITSRKAQTTRFAISGIKTKGQRQIVYLDTPGYNHQAKNSLQSHLIEVTRRAISDADLVVWVVAGSHFNSADSAILKVLARSHKPVISVINKSDLVTESDALNKQLERIKALLTPISTFSVSAKYKNGLEELETFIFSQLAPGPWYYDKDQYTDRDAKFLAAEIVREKLMRLFGDELPYQTTVLTDRLVTQNNLMTIDVTIYVERLGQKIIIIGEKGSALKRIGSLARVELERLFKHKIMLNLWVKIKTNWTKDAKLLQSLGYNS